MPMPALSRLLARLLLLGAASAALAQHETGSDLYGGAQAFGIYCATCHGATGDLVEGVDLGRAAFRQPYSDDDLIGIVMSGIPGTPMPPTPGMSREQAVEIVAYLRSRAAQAEALPPGDASRGAALFAGKGECFACHRVNGQGSRLGPDLSRIGQQRSAAELIASLLEPDALVLANQRYYAVRTLAGEWVEGRLLNHDTFSVQLLDSDERLRSFAKDALAEHGFLPSPMPSLGESFAAQELADLLNYLVSLRGNSAP